MARRDWCASRKVVSVKSRRFCEAAQRARPSGPFAIENLLRAFGRRAGDARGYGRGTKARGRGFAGDGRVAVDDDLGEISEEARGAVFAGGEAKERGRFLQPLGGDTAVLEIGVIDDVFEERDVGLHAAHAELAQGAVHARAGLGEVGEPTP